jgi:hypothetical protein
MIEETSPKDSIIEEKSVEDDISEADYPEEKIDDGIPYPRSCVSCWSPHGFLAVYSSGPALDKSSLRKNGDISFYSKD